MSYKILAKDLKEDKLKNIYLFYGDEEYLLKHYTNEIKKKVVSEGVQDLNFSVLEDQNATVSNITEFCDSFPVMSDKKLLIVKNFELFKGKKTKEVDELKDYLSNFPDYVHVIFHQNEINKKSSLYKFLQKNICCVEFKKLDNSQLVKWTAKQLKQEKKKIDINAAQYLVEILEGDMQKIKNECSKLSSFVEDRDIINIEDVNKVCKKSLNYKVFEMVDDIAQKKIDNAILKLTEIINSKEPEIKILGLIIWNIKTLLKVKLGLEEGLPANILAKRLGIGFINKYLNQSRNFNVKKLEEALVKCSKVDIEMKTMGLDNKILLEKLIVEIAC